MKVSSITPNLLVDDVSKSVEFYTDILGFNYIMGVDENKELYLSYNPKIDLEFAIVQNGISQIMFQNINSINNDLNLDLKRDINITDITLYIEIDGFDKFYENIKDKVTIVNEPRHTFYGMKEFYIRDNNDNIVAFAERLV